MSRDATLYLEDILHAGARIREYLRDYSFEKFSDDPRTQDAVIRQFEIIGEAVKQLPEEWTERESEIPWKAIAGFRDILAHVYFGVELSVVWNSSVEHLPNLLAACERLLRENQ